MKTLTINSITCNSATNGISDDDVFFMVQVDGGPPIRYPIQGTIGMSDDDHATLPPEGTTETAEFVYQYVANVSLWDADGLIGSSGLVNEADVLGNAMFDANASSGSVTVFGVNNANYTLDVSIGDAAPTAPDENAGLPATLQESIAQAVQSWSDSPDGKAALASTDTTTLTGLFQEALADTEGFFVDVIRDIGNNLPWITSVSLGVSIQAEIFIGLQGDFGVVMDLTEFPNSWAVYAGGALLEGLEGGVQGAINFGVWSQTTQEIGGFYEAAEVDITDVVGVSAAIWVSKGDKDKLSEGFAKAIFAAKAVFLGIDFGLEDGASAEEVYLFAGHLEDYPCFQTGSYKNMAVLTDLHCADQHSSRHNYDSVKLLWKVDEDDQKYRYPIWNRFEMGQDDLDHWSCGTVVKFDDRFKVTLYAKDNKGDEKEIEKTFNLSEFGSDGTMQETFDDGHTEYKLSAKLLIRG